MSFLSKKPRHGNIIATSDVLAIMMDDDILEKISPAMKDKFKDYLIQLLIKRLDKMNEAMLKIANFAMGHTSG
jgi:hypothetical protein